MPIDYRYLADQNVIYIECFGELTVDEIGKYFADVADDDSIPKGAAEIVDLSGITFFNVNHVGASSMPTGYAPALAKKEITATIQFGASPINHGLSLLIDAYFQRYMPQHPFRTVATYEDAIRTLGEIRRDKGGSAQEA